MDSPETLATLDTRHLTKTYKTKNYKRNKTIQNGSNQAYRGWTKELENGMQFLFF